jgi:methane/ammonia monooxygenase subunit B
MRALHRLRAGIGVIATLLMVSPPAAAPALAHGERAQEPYLRTRTVQFYDVRFDRTDVKVNDIITITGRFHLMQDWPDAVALPEVVFLATGTPGPAVVRRETYVNDAPARQSFNKMELGRDYSFKEVLQAREPGTFHIHPMVSVKGSGALVGPGAWITIGGSQSDFKYPLTTLTGDKIDDLQTFGVGQALGWYGVWILLAAFWLLFWITRPLLMPRAIAISKGREDLLISNRDLAVGIGLGVVVMAITIGGYTYYSDAYPYTVPLQSGTQHVDPLPLAQSDLQVKVLHATYDVPGRSMKIEMRMSNTGTSPLSIGEFATANLRFVNKALPAANANVDPAYPKELVARTPLEIDNPAPLMPGETRVVRIAATDAAWELERLTSFLTDVDSKFGALLFLFDAQGKRQMVEISGPIVPVFTDLVQS